MKCPACGNEISDRASFCNRCGTPVTPKETLGSGAKPPAPGAPGSAEASGPTDSLGRPIQPQPSYTHSQSSYTAPQQQYEPAQQPFNPAAAGAANARPGMSGFRIRPLGFGELFDYSFKLYFGNFKLLIGAAAISLLPVYILQILYGFLTAPSIAAGNIEATEAGEGLFGILLYIAITLQQAALIHIVSNLYLGKTANIRTGYTAARQRIFRIIGTAILLGLLYVIPAVLVVFLGAFFTTFLTSSVGPATGAGASILFFLIMIPIIILIVMFAVRFMLYPYAIMIEDKTAFDSLTRSSALVKGSWWKLVGLMFIVGIFSQIATALFLLPLQFVASTGNLSMYAMLAPILTFVGNIANMIVIPFGTIITILFYYDLRVRKEGFDLEMLANEIIR